MSESESPPPAKKQKKSEEDLVCPINLTLPVDPVLADDGHVYEREAIEKYIRGHNPTERLLSPWTRQPMGVRLISDTQTKKAIESLIENGRITKELAEDWMKRVKENEQAAEILKKAGQGDVDSMLRVANNYSKGINGFPEDEEKSYRWYWKAHENGSILGMTKVGMFLVAGFGVAKDSSTGTSFLRKAEKRGSNLAACALGTYMAEFEHGFHSAEQIEGRRLLAKGINDKYAHNFISDDLREHFERKLDELLNAPCP